MQYSCENWAELNNREKILCVSIELFSQKGFAGVSTREIASIVGIRAASIYNHFTSKEAILEEIVEDLRQGLHAQVHPAFETAEQLSLSTYIQFTTEVNNRFFTQERNARIGAILMREQFQNEYVRAMLLTEMLELPRRMIAAYFERLMDAGLMHRADPTFAAREYHSFFIYEFYESTLMLGLREPDAASAQQGEEHVKLFLQTWARNPADVDAKQ